MYYLQYIYVDIQSNNAILFIFVCTYMGLANNEIVNHKANERRIFFYFKQEM